MEISQILLVLVAGLAVWNAYSSKRKAVEKAKATERHIITNYIFKKSDDLWDGDWTSEKDIIKARTLEDLGWELRQEKHREDPRGPND